MNLNHDFVQVSKLSEDPQQKVFTKNGTLFPQIQMKAKKKSPPKMEHFFFFKFKWTTTLRCTPESNYWGGTQM